MTSNDDLEKTQRRWLDEASKRRHKDADGVLQPSVRDLYTADIIVGIVKAADQEFSVPDWFQQANWDWAVIFDADLRRAYQTPKDSEVQKDIAALLEVSESLSLDAEFEMDRAAASVLGISEQKIARSPDPLTHRLFAFAEIKDSLRAVCRKAISNIESRKGQHQLSARRQLARKLAVGELLPKYEKLTGKRPTSRVAPVDGSPYGPTFAFVSAALRPLYGDDAESGLKQVLAKAIGIYPE